MCPRDLPPVWLLGAGSSVAAGMPSTGAISTRVLDCKDVILDTQGRYRFGSPYGARAYSEDWVRGIRAALLEAKVLIDSYYSEVDRATSYEDLAYLLGQVEDTGTREYDNPAVQPLVTLLEPKLRASLDSLRLARDVPLWQLAAEAVSYIKDAVSHLLERPSGDLSALAVIVDCCRVQAPTAPVRLFTLNHDTVLEAALHEAGIGIQDGFSLPDGDVRYWVPLALQADDPGVYLHKLHGSVSWRRVRPFGRESDPASERIGILSGEGNRWPNDSRGQRLDVPDGGRSWLLVGTFNKMLEYTNGIYLAMLCRFVEALSRSDRLVVCGYGFGDKGINRILIDWMLRDSDNRLVVIDPGLKDLTRRARGAVAHAWPFWQESQRLKELEKGLETVAWAEVEVYL